MQRLFHTGVSVFCSTKKYSQILLMGFLVPSALALGAGKQDGKTVSAGQFVPGKESYRASFELDAPRRFATRYLSDTRSLEIRVSPARADEFDVSRYYDSRFIHRVVVEEKNNDVTLSFQLKNAPVAWFVGHQDNPWRIVVDIWRTEPFVAKSLEQEWAWQDDNSGTPLDSAPAKPVAEAKQSSANAVRPVEIDLPDDTLPSLTAGNSKAAVLPAKETSSSVDTKAVRLEAIVPLKVEEMAALERRAAAELGAVGEFDAIERLATALYRSGATQKAIPLFRRLSTLNARRFQDSPRLLWMAGESAFLAGSHDLANDFLQEVKGRFPGHEMASLAQFRMQEMRAARGDGNTAGDASGQYTEIALDDRAPWAARIGATVKLLESTVGTHPEAAKAHQAALQSCLNGNYVSEQVRQSCAYIQTKFAVSQVDVVSADAALQRFKTRYPSDARAPVLATELANRVRLFIDETARKKEYPSIAEFEKLARPELLEFTLREPELLMARVEAALSVADNKKALQLLQVFASTTSDENKRNEALAISSQIHLKLKQTERAEAVLKKLFASEIRKTSGLSDRATAALREAARPPANSKTAQSILLDELKFGRYVERDVSMLSALAVASRGREDSEKAFELLMTTTPRTDQDARQIESALFLYADDLRSAGRLAKSGDVFLAVANLAQANKKAEAAYKAGIMYARAGMVEKAKAAWTLSAADTSDKKFSSLASERLERIR
jgi:hypothetical protein